MTVGEHHATSPSATPPGGEWDGWFCLPHWRRRMLIGSEWFTAGGMQPDVFADHLALRLHIDGWDALAWFYRMVPRAVEEQRSARNRDRHQRLAERHGFRNYYAYRDWLCRDAGIGSLWRYRRENGWS